MVEPDADKTSPGEWSARPVPTGVFRGGVGGGGEEGRGRGAHPQSVSNKQIEHAYKCYMSSDDTTTSS